MRTYRQSQRRSRTGQRASRTVRQGSRTGRRYEAVGTLAARRTRADRSPARPARRWLLSAFLLLLGALVIGVSWFLRDDRFYVWNAEVIGTARVSPGQVFEASDLYGLHVLWARPSQVEADVLARLPGLESVQVECGLPAVCTIRVVERQPRMTWDDGEQLWWVDADGVVFPAEGVLSEAWLVQGPLVLNEDGLVEEQVRVGLFELWASGATMSPVLQYVPGRGLVITDERGWRVIVGQGSGMDDRMRLLDRLAAHVQARGVAPRFVDVRFLDAPYYSLVNDW